MNATLQNGEFGPIGHENGLPKPPEIQTHHETEAGILPGDSEAKIALVRLNKLRAEGADIDTIHKAESILQHATDTEQIQAAKAARADIAAIHGTDTAQPAQPAEQSTPYPVHTMENFAQRPVATNLTPQRTQGPQLSGDQTSGPQLAEQIRHDLAAKH